MDATISKYNEAQVQPYNDVCNRLSKLIDQGLPEAQSKIWHAHPVWFLDGNPIVGYSKQKPGIRLMFWSGASFDEESLVAGNGKFKDASIFYTSVAQIKAAELKRWLEKSKSIQWDYANIVKRKGRLEPRKTETGPVQAVAAVPKKQSASHDQRFAEMVFGSVYPLYVAKVEKKGRTKDELDRVIQWLSGYNQKTIQRLITKKVTFETFFAGATLNPNARLITGVICGYRVEEIENELTQKVRYLDKLVDELAKGKDIGKILRDPSGRS